MQNSINDRLIRKEASARINTMESELYFLHSLHYDLGRQYDSLGERIDLIKKQIEAEKASVDY